MIPHGISAYSPLFRDLLEPALRSLSIGLLAAAAIFAFRVKSAQMRLVVWTGVLYAALAMPFLAASMPRLSVPLPRTIAAGITQASTALRASGEVATPSKPAPVITAEAVAHVETGVAPRTTHRAVRLSTGTSLQVAPASSFARVAPRSEHVVVSAAPQQTRTGAPQRIVPWLAIASVLYALVAAVLLARILLGAIFAHRLSMSADTIADPNALRVLLRRARAAGLKSAPRLAESDLVSVPVTLGIVNPVILLPIHSHWWDEATLSAVVAHEVSHIARRDALTQRLSLIHRAIFWFSPLAWWLNRALVDAAEEASDEAAIAAGTDRAFYAETLLGFFAALSEGSGRVYWQGVSMAAPGQAERRLDRILNSKGAVGMRLKKSVALAVALAGIPVVLLAAAARPASRIASAPAAPQGPRAPHAVAAPAAPTIAPLSALPALAALADTQAPQAPPAPQAAPTPAPVAPAAPETAPVPVPGPTPMPAAPVLAPPVPPAPGIMVTPKISMGEFRTEIKNEIESDVDMGIVDSMDLKTLGDLNKQITLSLKTMPQFSKQDAKQLEGLKQQLDNLKKQDAANHPDVIKLQKQIADLQANMKMELEPFTVVTPFNGQEKNFVFRIGPDGDRFVIVSNNSPIIMSGDSQDVEHATTLRSKINGDFIWFQHDEKSYIIRDQNLVNQARAYFKPEQDLGDQQAALGKQQRDLGDQMRGMGDKMRDTKVTVPDMSAQMQKLMDQMKQLSTSGGTPQQLGDLQRQLGELQRQIGQAESKAVDPQREVGTQMRDLGEKQRELGAQQRDLGQKQRDASNQARQQMKQLLDDAIAKNTAQPE